MTDAAPNVTIVEPTLNIAKTITPATGVVGDTHSVTLVISHTAASDADAFNIEISDVLPAGMTIAGAITVTPTGGVKGLVDTSAGSTISVAAASIPDGDTITITFNVTLDQTVQANELITNTADVDWTSLPGDVTTTQSPHTTLGVERTGDPSDPGGTDNDYNDSGSDDVTVRSPLISKQLISTSIVNGSNANNQATIGETAVYQVTITLPEGQTIGAAIVDTLDAGLHFVSLDSITRSSGTVTTSVGATTFSDTASFAPVVAGSSATGETLTINLGDLNNQATNVAPDTITLRYTVRVDNVPANVGAPEAPPTSLDNVAALEWDLNGNTQITATVSAAPIGEYTARVAPPAGFDPTFDADDGTVLPDHTSALTLTDNEDNLDQDFGYQGLGSIAGRVAEDANNNKHVDPTEPGFKEVPIQLMADINGDGIVDFTLNTITGPNGEYSFGNLPAGDYKITVVVPPANREQSADPDLVNDDETVVNLAPLENKLDVEFGYLSDYEYSYFFDPRNNRPGASLWGNQVSRPTGMLPPLPDPMFTGITEPGTTLTVSLFDEAGGLLADKMVQSDAAGNWQVSFHGTTLKQIPHSMRISVTPAIYNSDIDSSFNLRRYFHNVGIGQIFANFDGSVQKVFASRAGNVLMHMEQADHNPLGFGWHRHSYEQLASSPTPVED